MFMDRMESSTQSYASKFLKINILRSFSFNLVDTFLILYLLDLLSYQQIGMILAVRFATQAILDYPTGVLGDLIGHDRVLKVAYVFHLTSLVFLISYTSFWPIMASYFFLAVASSQESGALETWFDNKYQDVQPDDAEKKLYGGFMGQFNTLNTALMGLTFILSGVLALGLGRLVLLWFRLGIVVIIFMLINKYVQHSQTSAINYRQYMNQLTKGVKFVFTDKGRGFYFAGSSLIFASFWSIWGSQMLFPIYLSYGTNDFNTGLLRSTIFWIGVIWSLIAARLSTRISRIHLGIAILQFIAGPIFLVNIYLYIKFFPAGPLPELGKIIGLIIVFQTVGFTMAMDGILRGRLLINLVPNEMRNSVYSFFPTLITLFSIPLAWIGGQILASHGILTAILLLLGLISTGVVFSSTGLYFLSQPQDEEAVFVPQKEILVVAS